MPNPTEDQSISEPEWFDPFPELRTIPAGWDLSELFAAPQRATDFERHADEADATDESRTVSCEP